MLNYLWTAMLLIGVFTGAVTGHMEDISNAFVSSAQDAVDLCITMLGVMVMWSGVMKIAQASGLLGKLTKLLMPVLRFLFPNIPRDHPSAGFIATNCVANILGLGWAATPAGLSAMESLAALEDERRGASDGGSEACPGDSTAQGNLRKRKRVCAMPKGVASNEMCTFLILNISSLQIIPVSIIAYRSQYGSVNPTRIVGPAIIATAVSTAVAVLFCRLMDKKVSRHEKNCCEKKEAEIIH